MRSRLTFPLLAFLPVLLAGTAPVAAPSTQPAVESTEVEKDSVAVTLVMTKTAISTDQQPQFIVRFRNIGKEQYRNLYDVAAYWNWMIDLTSTDPQPAKLTTTGPQAAGSSPWRLHMNSIPMRIPLEYRQIKPGESTDVSVNLNDPPFTFDYVYAGEIKPLISPLRHLAPGHYQITATVALTNPFGPGYFVWTGPVTTAGVGLTVTQAPKNTATKEEQAAYDAAIVRVTDELQPSGLWMNGVSPKIEMPKDAKPEDVIDAAVNNAILDSKAYRVLSVKPFARNQMPGKLSGSAALLQVGKAIRS